MRGAANLALDWTGLSLVGPSAFASRAKPTPRTRKKAAMPAMDTPLSGDQLLAGVTDAMVSVHERHRHRAPAALARIARIAALLGAEDRRSDCRSPGAIVAVEDD